MILSYFKYSIIYHIRYKLTYEQFLKELNKKKIVLDYNEEGKLEDYFLNEQEEAIKLKAKIDKTDREIDSMVYELYSLTKEEVEIAELKEEDMPMV